MKHRQFVRGCLAGLLILLVMLTSAPMMGQESTVTPFRLSPTNLPGGYPQYDDVYINDFANILSPTTEEKLRQDLIMLWDSGIETTIVTMDSYTDYDTDAASFEEFATNLFNLWGVGDSDSDGVMILVGVEDRKVRIEVGVSYENTMNRTMQGVINEFMLPRFRQNDYEQGIIDGTAAVVRALTGETVFTATAVPTRRPSSTVSTDYTPRSSGSSNLINFVALGAGVAGIGGIGMAAFRRFTRFRPRNCPNCDQPMIRLDEIADDDFLDDGQRREEALQSVDYDVWKCQNCSTHQVFAYGAMMSGYRECTRCRYRTMGTHSRVIDRADCYSSGLREVTVSCDHCGYHHVYQETIPRKNCDDNNSSSSFGSSSRSSSRSGKSSFGGGRSSGGGASGSW